MRTLITGGTILTAIDHYQGDLLIIDGVIDCIGVKLSPAAADNIIDAKGCFVMPGAIDAHVHLDLPFGGTRSSDDFESGTIAAACGGTTTIVDFAVQQPGESLQKGWEAWMAKAEGKAVVDYGFHMIMREFNGERAVEMAAMVREGVTSFKVFTAYPGVFMLDDGGIYQAMQCASELGALIMVHAENGHVIDVLVRQALARGETAPKYHALTRPALAEAEATRRAIMLAQMAAAPVYIVHLTAAEALAEVVAARDLGQRVFAETCPQYLFLSHRNYEEPGFDGAKYVMSPPLRSATRQQELWRGLAAGDLHVVATDHCPFNMKGQKDLGRADFSKIPNGLPGIETRVGLLYDGGVCQGRISLHRWVDAIATAPAKIFGMFPRKGTLAPGCDADVLIFDPDGETRISAATHHMNVDYNPYEGRILKGAVSCVLSRGEVVVQGGKFRGQAGRGRFLRRAAAAAEAFVAAT